MLLTSCRGLLNENSSSLSRRSILRCLSTTTAQLEKALPPRRKIHDSEIIENFVRGTGPGGQTINQTSCAVQLKHIATGIVVKSQETRSREQNRKYARLVLGEKLDALEKGSESRLAIKTERATRKKASASKKTRRKYKKLEDGKLERLEGLGEDEREKRLEAQHEESTRVEQQLGSSGSEAVPAKTQQQDKD